MNKAGWIVALIVLLSAALLVHLEMGSMDEERQEWRAKEDSLRNVAAEARAEGQGWKMYADSLKAHTDSIAATFEPETVIVTRWLSYTKYAPLELVRDSLMTP